MPHSNLHTLVQHTTHERERGGGNEGIFFSMNEILNVMNEINLTIWDDGIEILIGQVT